MSNKDKTQFVMKVCGFLVIVSVIAGVIDHMASRTFMSAHGIGWFDAPGWKLAFEYFSSYPGNLLTTIELVSLIAILPIIYWGYKD
jgi:hypothetical protein